MKPEQDNEFIKKELESAIKIIETPLGLFETDYRYIHAVNKIIEIAEIIAQKMPEDVFKKFYQKCLLLKKNLCPSLAEDFYLAIEDIKPVLKLE